MCLFKNPKGLNGCYRSVDTPPSVPCPMYDAMRLDLAEMLLIMLVEELGMNVLVVSVCLVSTVVSQTCVDTSSLLTTAYAP